MKKFALTERQAELPWVAHNPHSTKQCDGISYARRRQCKRTGNMVYVELNGNISHYCVSHVSEQAIMERDTELVSGKVGRVRKADKIMNARWGISDGKLVRNGAV